MLTLLWHLMLLLSIYFAAAAFLPPCHDTPLFAPRRYR